MIQEQVKNTDRRKNREFQSFERITTFVFKRITTFINKGHFVLDEQ